MGSLYEKTNGSPTKHIFLGSQRICSISNLQSPIYYHTNHLGSTDTITDSLGEQVVHYEYEPYGQIVVTDGADATDYKFTGKPLDDETGLYFYGARYYNPTIGRFITPDTIVQAPNNPQTLNRYTYCNNNPVNNVDPTGHSWWNSVKKFFSEWGWVMGMTGGLINGIINNDWRMLQAQATTFATAFVFSGFNPVAATAALMTMCILETPPGKDLTEFTANEIFDDAFGMKPKAAYISASVTLQIAGTLAFEAMLANLTAEAGTVVDFNKDNPKHMDLIKGEKYGYNTYSTGPDPTNPEAVANWVAAGKVKVIEGTNGNMALAGSRPYALGSVHTGANSPNFPKALNMKYPSNLPFHKGTTFGFCQQATNATLLKAGFSNVVTQTSGNYSTYLTTFLYGNYGGGLMVKANSAYQAYNNWEQGR